MMRRSLAQHGGSRDPVAADIVDDTNSLEPTAHRVHSVIRMDGSVGPSIEETIMAESARKRSDVGQRSQTHDSPDLTGSSGTAAFSHADREQVARRAFELYERRGGEHGRDWDDWFQAEEELGAGRRH